MGWRELVDAAADLAWGGACPSCSRPGLGLCDPCRRNFAASPALATMRPLEGFPPTWCRGWYADELRDLIVACKERHGLGLVNELADLALGSAAGLLRTRWKGGVVTLVPVPSARRSAAERGFDLTGMMTRRIARGLRDTGLEVEVWAGLVQRGPTRDQVGLDAASRLVNRSGSLRLTGARVASQLVLVDDIVTSGATLAEAAGCLRRGEHQVLGAAVVASTRKWSLGSPE